MKNIHIIPTDKSSRLIKNNHSQLLLTIQTLPLDRELGCFPQNIYITNDEEEAYTYALHIKKQEILKINGIGENSKELFHDKGFNYQYECKKIILTDNQDLIKDGVQAIDDEFLEWFVKNPSCEKVEIEKVFGGNSFVQYGKEPSQKERLRGCYDNGEQITGKWEELFYYKIIIPSEEPKQETLEEAAFRLYPRLINDPYNPEEDDNKEDRNIWINGAKWQQERMYSEADKIMKFLDTEKKLKLSDAKTIERIKWYFETYFEQFKKK